MNPLNIPRNMFGFQKIFKNIMPINFERKCIFIHIPKTGGSSILIQLGFKKIPYALWDDTWMILQKKGKITSLKEGRLQHLPAYLVKELRSDVYDEYYKFSIVRHPYYRSISEYVWRNKFNIEFPNFSKEKHRTDFENYLDMVEKDKTWSNRNNTQYSYLHDSSGKLLVDVVAKLENIDEDFKPIFKKLGLNDEKVIHENKPKVMIDKEYLLTDKNKEKIHNMYKIDFDTFNYQK